MPTTVREYQDSILKAKKERGFSILAHIYQSPEIVEIADFTGDSFALSKKAMGVSDKNVLMCGVRFMAETVKLLSPEKRVILAAPDAGCPMAEQFVREEIEDYRADHPDVIVVAYVNTTASLKCVADVCVTSASALSVVGKLPKDKEILFIPDCNLGAYVSSAYPDRKITLWRGGCPIHAGVSVLEAKDAIARHPGAKLLVHPECTPAVTALADYIGSTTGIINYASESDAKEFIIGTELSVVWHLSYRFPDKKFYPLTKNLVCRNMRLTSLPDVLAAINGTGGEEITLDDATLRDAKVCIDKMMELA
ncbi:MAG: quinolinate synthase NadA [Clostridia bacterium]|nr:quinolinate synthase NadA [Clostridia bacterium]